MNKLSNKQTNWLTINTRFGELSNDEKNHVITKAEEMMSRDSDFTSMLIDGIDRGKVFIMAIHVAVNQFLKAKFHSEFGWREW